MESGQSFVLWTRDVTFVFYALCATITEVRNEPTPCTPTGKHVLINVLILITTAT